MNIRFLVPHIDYELNNQPLPPGLVILTNILSPHEEEAFIQSMGNWTTDNVEIESKKGNCQTLKHREVKHFGYKFLFQNNNVDKNKPLLNQPIPSECEILWPRLKKYVSGSAPPNQLTVNKYNPGQGSIIQ